MQLCVEDHARAALTIFQSCHERPGRTAWPPRIVPRSAPGTTALNTPAAALASKKVSQVYVRPLCAAPESYFVRVEDDSNGERSYQSSRNRFQQTSMFSWFLKETSAPITWQKTLSPILCPIFTRPAPVRLSPANAHCRP